MTTIRYHHRDAHPFHTQVWARSEAWFKAHGKTRFGGPALYWKTAFWLAAYWGMYALILSKLLPFPAALLAWCGFGFAMLLLSLNIGHDASHGCFSPHRRVNAAFAYVFELIGTSNYLWAIMHNRAHHGYVNLHVNDVAIQTEPLLRLSPDAPHYPWQRWQHLYAIPLYSVSTLFWVLLKDFRFIAKDHIGPFDTRRHPWHQYVQLVGFKILYIGYVVLVPWLWGGIPLVQVLVGFVVMHLTMGITLGLTFQTTHAVEETQDPRWLGPDAIDSTWAIHVLSSTSDFATQSRLLNFLFGGLNCHVAHHLFPNISHVHYPEISKIIEEVARAHGLPYIQNKHMWAAALSHLRYLKRLGQEAPQASMALPTAKAS